MHTRLLISLGGRKIQINFDGKTLDSVAIELIQKHEPQDGYYLGFSGGKDSVVIHHLTERAGVKFDAHYAVSPIDPPPIRWFIREYYPAVIWDYHAKGFFNNVLSLGLPTGKQRWCCRLIKECGGVGRTKILGMRKAESFNRRSYNEFEDASRQGSNTYWLLPILNWSDSDIWQYISEHSLPVSSLYRNGFKRIGCVLCPFHGVSEKKLELELYPKVANAWRKSAEKYFYKRMERGTPLTQQTPDEYWRWWLYGN